MSILTTIITVLTEYSLRLNRENILNAVAELYIAQCKKETYYIKEEHLMALPKQPMRYRKKKILLKEPLAFFGEDHDSGFRYGWTFFVDAIAETVDAPEEPSEKPHWYDIAVNTGRAEPVTRIKQGKTYLYEDGRSCALEFKDLNDIQNFIMYMVTIGREFENGYEIIFPNDQDTVDKYNEILAEEQ